ncbi:PREDICTED: uncharacterized protein LOC109580696 [Amphimedon queenslandica]|uniref:Dynamin N-terminal domain-containing protein n=1 Tax=Amphimedon queenslandica TaxID=400682 RepID=A0A1X7VVQ1_AMPQE|nr:PREDICTED: uncharacterized protein LOC109580696 [Amphimedon queenslandica]|eukprot:XP_019849712.1 PREDICTED: uncharacterized protein LOC109580696 [Amphimedon queenslandica]
MNGGDNGEPIRAPINGDGPMVIIENEGVVNPPARPDDIESADNIEQLFRVVENLTRENLNIMQDLVRMTGLGEPHNVEEEDITKRIGGEKTLEEDLAIDSTLIDLADNTLSRLKGVLKWLQEIQPQKFDVPQFNDAIEKVLRQLVDKRVYICVLGRYNVGKTTLINALLRNEVLPVHIVPETAITLYIQHDDKLKDTVHVPPEPRLINYDDSQLLAKGVEQVRKTLSKLHREIREKSVRSNNNYLLKINFPLLSVRYEDNEKLNRNPVPMLVDTPGSNEVGEAQFQIMAEQNLKSAAAYIFVMKYDDIKNKEDYAALKMIYDRDPSIFQSERLTIVITYYDKAYENEHSHMTVKAIQELVARTISQEIKANVSNNIIIPICGKLASDARQCGRISGAKRTYNEVQMSIISVKSFESVDSDLSKTSQEVFSMQKDDVLRTAEEVCRIAELEERIKLVIAKLSSVWKSNIVGSCHSFLDSTSDCISQLQEVVERDVRDITDQIHHASRAVDHHKDMLKSITRESEVLIRLRESFDADANYDAKFHRKIEDRLQTLKHTLTEKRRVRKYSIQELTAEVNESFQKNVMTEIKTWFFQTKFVKCQRCLHLRTQRISEKFGRFRAAVAMVQEHGATPQTMASFYQELGAEPVGDDVDDVMESKLNNMAVADLNTIIHKTYSFRMKLPFVKANVLNEEDIIDQLVANRRNAIKELHGEFFAAIKEPIVLHFFKLYVNTVLKELQMFERMLERDGGHEKVRRAFDKKDELAPKQQIKRDCQVLQSHLKKLKSKLTIMSEQ